MLHPYSFGPLQRRDSLCGASRLLVGPFGANNWALCGSVEPTCWVLPVRAKKILCVIFLGQTKMEVGLWESENAPTKMAGKTKSTTWTIGLPNGLKMGSSILTP